VNAFLQKTNIHISVADDIPFITDDMDEVVPETKPKAEQLKRAFFPPADKEPRKLCFGYVLGFESFCSHQLFLSPILEHTHVMSSSVFF
jgi:hypothetical protein